MKLLKEEAGDDDPLPRVDEDRPLIYDTERKNNNCHCWSLRWRRSVTHLRRLYQWHPSIIWFACVGDTTHGGSSQGYTQGAPTTVATKPTVVHSFEDAGACLPKWCRFEWRQQISDEYTFGERYLRHLYHLPKLVLCLACHNLGWPCSCIHRMRRTRTWKAVHKPPWSTWPYLLQELLRKIRGCMCLTNLVYQLVRAHSHVWPIFTFWA